MPHNRFWYDGSLAEGAVCRLCGEESRHLLQVMRKGEGAIIELVNGQGLLAQAQVFEVDKKGCLSLVRALHSAPRERPRLLLRQAMPRLNRLEYVIEKGVELGVDHIELFEGERSEKAVLSPNQWQRLRHIAIAALKQSGRLYLPPITMIQPIALWQPCRQTAYFGDIRDGAPKLAEALAAQPSHEEYTICIGPEGGFSDNEVASLEQKGYRGVSLHHNVLRTDTAPLVALALFSHLLR